MCVCEKRGGKRRAFKKTYASLTIQCAYSSDPEILTLSHREDTRRHTKEKSFYWKQGFALTT